VEESGFVIREKGSPGSAELSVRGRHPPFLPSSQDSATSQEKALCSAQDAKPGTH